MLFLVERARDQARFHWLDHRRNAAFLQRSWIAWHRLVLLSKSIACISSRASSRRSILVLLEWHRIAQKSIRLKRGLEAVRDVLGRQLMSTAFSSWRAYISQRYDKATSRSLAEKHRHRFLKYSCFWAWIRMAEKTALEREQVQAMQVYQKAVQVALRWQSLSRGVRRQAAIVDRAIRMHSHRVVASCQRMVMRAWALEAAESSRLGLLRCRAVQSLSYLRRLSRSFHAWSTSCAQSKAQELKESRCKEENAVQRLQSAQAEIDHFVSCLDVNQGKIEEAEASISKMKTDQEESERREQSMSKDLDEAKAQNKHLANLNVKLEEEVIQLGAEVARGNEVEVLLRTDKARLELELAESQQQLRESSIRATQSSAKHQVELEDLKVEIIMMKRENEVLAQSAKRAEMRLKKMEDEAKHLRDTTDQETSRLRALLRAKDRQVAFIEASIANNAHSCDGKGSSFDVTMVEKGLHSHGVELQMPLGEETGAGPNDRAQDLLSLFHEREQREPEQDEAPVSLSDTKKVDQLDEMLLLSTSASLSSLLNKKLTLMDSSCHVTQAQERKWKEQLHEIESSLLFS